jgi:thiosulfate/3-mercaptopyruvate sulfurtransferase
MKARVKWMNGAGFLGESGSGHSVLMDGPPEAGGQNLGVRPMEMLLIGLGGCTAFDVVHILKKSRKPITDCVVEVEAERAQHDPKVFTKIVLDFTVYGHGLSLDDVEPAILLTRDKYCSASIMFSQVAEVSHRYSIVNVDQGQQSTPPGDRANVSRPQTPNPFALVSTEWLSRRLGDAAVRVIDIRSSIDGGGRKAYEAAHIPGAVHTDYVKDGWRSARGSASGLLPDVDALSKLFGSIGLTPDLHAVIVPAGVSAGDFSAAARVYWTLKVAGHRRLSVLNGGFAAWRSDPMHPIESGSGWREPAPPYPIQLDESQRASLAEVEHIVTRGGRGLIDTRSEAYFEGREKSPQARVGGRLPNAANYDHAEVYNAKANRLRSRDELTALFRRLPGGQTVSYCNTGHQAATTWFALSEILGRSNASLYDGSMSEWTEDPGRPVATGPAVAHAKESAA